ncbi:MAG TPA: hypothetical protein VKS79_19765 [Gemmataceae bacterium]|nr:hypothetical protein [Gemmataceae bacterium]
MKRLLVWTAIGAVAITVMLARPNTGHAQPPPDDSGPGFLNYLFDRWVDNRREARGIPVNREYHDFRSWYAIYGDPPSLGDRLFSRWIDNRRASGRRLFGRNR